MKKIITVLLSIAIGSVFIVSAAVKIVPMEPFEYQFVDMGVASWHTAPYIARFFIGMEFFLGLLLILNISLKRFTLKFAVILLTVFSVYLVYKIISEGNTGNCGCFGEAIKMSPLEGIIKNVILIAACLILYYTTGSDYWDAKWKMIFIPVLVTVSIGLGFLIYPVNIQFQSTMDKAHVNYKLPLELMYTDRQKEKPKTDLTKGKHIIAFLSLTCPHCRIAAQKMHVMHRKNPDIPFYFALNGDAALEQSFFDDTHTQDIPHNLFLGPKEWIPVAGISLPVIMYVDNGIVKKKCDGMELDESDIEAWLKK